MNTYIKNMEEVDFKKAKKIEVGIGYSKLEDSYAAAIEAARMALNKCSSVPKLSLVYTNSKKDQKQILKGINEVLGKNWVGISTDKQYNNELGYDPTLTVSVLCISSQYLIACRIVI